MHGITERQRAVLEFIRTYQQKRGCAPSYREIALFLGSKTPRTAQMHVIALERKGYIHRTPGIARAIKIVKAAA